MFYNYDPVVAVDPYVKGFPACPEIGKEG